MWRAFIGTWAGIAGSLALLFQIAILVDLWPFILFLLIFGLFVNWSEKKLKELEERIYAKKTKQNKLSKKDLEIISQITRVRSIRMNKFKSYEQSRQRNK